VAVDAAVQMMCARIGKVTGQGLAANFKQRFPNWLLLVVVTALLAANTINIGADLAGMADAAEMLSGINSHLFEVGFALLISWATVRLHYHQIANVLKWLVLVLFAYPITAFVVGADWRGVARATLIPSMPHSRDEWSMLVAILGTTISPYLFFWQASEEVEEEKSAGQSTLSQRRGATIKELELRNFDVGVGAFFSNMVMFFIILTTAITLNRHGITHRDDTPSRRSPSAASRQVRCDPVYRRHRRCRISSHPNAGGISGICLRGNAWLAPGTGQRFETRTRALYAHFALDRCGCRTRLYRH
jgi:Mn2+/Fe2+ NRAMP family transporter